MHCANIVITTIVTIILIVFLFLIPLFFCSRKSLDYFSNENFTVPPSYTKLNFTSGNNQENIGDVKQKNDLSSEKLLIKYSERLYNISNNTKTVSDVNILSMPSFFNSGEKWPGCLPRPLYQGSCGSCWGFATVTCLSSRFYIESCGNSGCNNYPQVNAGSLDDVLNNINTVYKFRKIFLTDIAKYIDSNSDGIIEKKEWIESAAKNQRKLWSDKVSENEKFVIAQILIHMLDFQSLGSIRLDSESTVIKRASKTFNIWANSIDKKQIIIGQLKNIWRNQPVGLSAEKIIACCTDCIKMDFKSRKIDKHIANNPICKGGSLEESWVLLRDTGTVSSFCISYNLDSYRPGDPTSSCSDIQGPYYSFCSGYVLKKQKSEILKDKMNKMEGSGIFPFAIPNNSDVPWKDPQLIRFRAKNAYTVPNNVEKIQREIIQRGPVTTGFVMYKDFENDFGKYGNGGQKYKGKNPLGSSSDSLIYMKDPETREKPTGGHAITIVGWGSYEYKDSKGNNYEIPYWTCLNSWGIEWGHNGFPEYTNRKGLPTDMKMGGYFWMVRGINNCGIENNVVCGQPNIENMSYPGVINKYGWGLESPNVDDVSFLEKLKTEDLTVRGSTSLKIDPATEGGSTYVDLQDDTWIIKSSKPPSPYLMFWPKNRPVYCVGSIIKKIDDKNTELIVNKETTERFRKILTKINNPLIIINDEQMQLLSINNNSLKVNRAVNYNTPDDHNEGSIIKIIPYQNLYIEYLEKNGFKEC